MHCCSNTHEVAQAVEVLLGFNVIFERVVRSNSVCAYKSTKDTHVMAVARGGPIGAVVDPILSLNKSQRQHRRYVPSRVKRVRAGVVPGSPHELLIDALSLTKRVRNQHNWLILDV